MSALVAYDDSDDEDIQPEKPAKIPKLDAAGLQAVNLVIGGETGIAASEDVRPEEPVGTGFAPAALAGQMLSGQEKTGPQREEAPGPAPAPSTLPLPEASLSDPQAEEEEEDDEAPPPLSPYTSSRQRLHALTMPTHPNFDIPSSPPPPPSTSEEAATLAATTKKFARFLDLKKQGVHFNDRLRNSTALGNPSLLPKLQQFAGISQEDSWRSSLSEEMGGVPVKWPEECHVEALVRENERRENKRQGRGREKVEFVPAKGGKDGLASGKSTPGTGSGTGSGREGRKSRFDKR